MPCAMLEARNGWCYFFFSRRSLERQEEDDTQGCGIGRTTSTSYQADRKKKQYLVVMENYYTLNKTIVGTRWPLKEIGKNSIVGVWYN